MSIYKNHYGIASENLSDEERKERFLDGLKIFYGDEDGIPYINFYRRDIVESCIKDLSDHDTYIESYFNLKSRGIYNTK